MSHNPVRPWRDIARRKSRQIMVGNVAVGGDAPISVQTMTNTVTSDVKATIEQVQRCADAGADIVRVSTPDEASTRALREIVAESPVPIVADIHFHYRRAIEAAEAGAACLRINPGNIGDQKRVKEVIKAARDHGCSIRIGVNAGSLEKHLLEKYAEPCPDAMLESGLDHIKILQDNDFHDFKISMKASDVFMTAAAYQQLADATDAPIHLGITEAGGMLSGTVKSAIGLGNLLWMGIGDTIRVSLSADPVQEVKVGYEILKSLGLRHRGVTIISCPSCARQGFDVIKTVAELEDRLAHVTTSMSLSIIGCVVNGPGEALMTDLGFTGGGAGSGMVYVAGRQSHKMSNDRMIDQIVEMVEKRAAELEAEAAAEAAKTAEAAPDADPVARVPQKSAL
ncbi:4-hydroxy-3-methylbut-2-en-1-yl diphosphate synthase [Defluviimonas sp. 20V17]|uniref:4-hydroxy-3-methylbut-2-en-1-yl diphosphate synthase (flavodoxin) n=1 Tax=Allgaiera indica TaxID=765699 RepID=A0AAN4UQT2_9RHOB|nr:flavodoxin-dependent (E)-4-hydroxy-3-methylbut-2-enyl-diphosphate synthase [Allgaiera indica]KDB03327.1 4-hydroxy-3-methylbut-2-en-1-yl diphosphate synthase [Defluviimonas sp. 20V17]GHE00430.1 4-hydroxy-3-methylbut-2-en-1-yl diphosphate synthase (flavodoxin) [Allgaiera indica]SDW62070.1 4-hydroxy-3-methylbut-2-en-1-yl diphosphate synthase [Allgaiera indica]